jgi:molybdopterin synthase catalytic subunit
MNDNYLVEGPVTTEIISSFIRRASFAEDAGGVSFFLGQVRADEIGGKKVKAIEYSAYENMIKAEADKIIGSVLSKFSDVKTISIIHSTGVVKVGELSLAVMVSARHRRHAIDACSETVELIKEKLPVWKKEIFEDNSHHWRENE